MTAGALRPSMLSPRRTVRALAIVVLVATITLDGCGQGASPATVSPVAPSQPGSGLASAAATGSASGLSGTAFPTIHLSGQGNDVASFTTPDAVPAIAVVSDRGTGPLAVETLATDGTVIDTLVATSAPYAGTTLFDWQAGDQAVALRVTADGPWTIDVAPVDVAQLWDGQAPLDGVGDLVVRLPEPTAGLLGVHVHHEGPGGFAVVAFTSEADESGGSPYRDLARDARISVGGPYDGVFELPDSTSVVAVHADGAWQMAPG